MNCTVSASTILIPMGFVMNWKLKDAPIQQPRLQSIGDGGRRFMLCGGCSAAFCVQLDDEADFVVVSCVISTHGWLHG